MGLDMYLKKVIHTYSFNIEPKTFKLVRHFGNNQKEKEEKEFETQDISSIVYTIGYWRKANHIHKWFVDHVQDGNDDCKEYYVTREQLNHLYEICKKVIELRYQNISKDKMETKLAELLPTQSGFFFGGTEYDEWYFGAIEETIEMIEKEKENKEDWEDTSTISYYYDSSW